SSHNDRNYFELAYALSRQSDQERGMYRDLALTTFADNHDVDRIASRLAEPADLYPLYAALFTTPGVPVIYYGSEWGIGGRGRPHGDAPLRPALEPAELPRRAPRPALWDAVRRFVRLRRAHPALRRGSYRQLHVAHEQLVFQRSTAEEQLVIALNAGGRAAELPLTLPGRPDGRLVDLLDDDAAVALTGGPAAGPASPPSPPPPPP